MIHLVNLFSNAYLKMLFTILIMTEESKYRSDMRKEHFKKGLVMTKKNDKDFENSSNCRTCDNV